MQYILILLLVVSAAVSPAWAGARYKLAYKVKANDLIRMVAQAADLQKFESAGEEIQIEGAKVFVKGTKTGFILDLAKNEMLLLDHEAKTFEKMRPTDMKARIAGAFPPGVEGLLRRMFQVDGKEFTEVQVSPTELAGAGEKRVLERFRAQFGLVYLLPGVDSIISFTPSIESKLATLGKGEGTPTAMRFAIGSGGRLLDAEVRVIDYEERTIPASVFQAPTGYVAAP